MRIRAWRKCPPRADNGLDEAVPRVDKGLDEVVPVRITHADEDGVLFT